MTPDRLEEQLDLVARLIAETSPEPADLAIPEPGRPRERRSWVVVLGSALAVSLIIGIGLNLAARNLRNDPSLGPAMVPPILDDGFAAVWLRTSDPQRVILEDGRVTFAELRGAHAAAIECLRDSGNWYVGGGITIDGAASITVTDDRGITDNPGPSSRDESAEEARERCLAEYFDDAHSLYVAPVDLDTIEVAAGPFVWIGEEVATTPVEAALAFARQVLRWPSPTVITDPGAFVPPAPGDWDYSGMIGLTHGDSSRVLLISSGQVADSGPHGILQLGTNERPGGVNAVMVGQAGSSLEGGSLVGPRPDSGAEVGIPPLAGADTAAVLLRTIDSRRLVVIVPSETLEAGRVADRWVSIGETGLTTYLDIDSILVLYLDADGVAIGATGGSMGAPAESVPPDPEGVPFLGLDLTGWEFWRAVEGGSGCSDNPEPTTGQQRQASYTLGSLPAGEHPLFLDLMSLNVNVTPASARCSFQDTPQSAAELGPPADPPAVVDHGLISVMGHDARVVEEQGSFSVYWLLDDVGSVARLDVFPHGSHLSLEDVVEITAGIVELTPEQWEDLLGRTPETPPDTTP